jgi:DNA-binding MarR family transcriptional regulator
MIATDGTTTTLTLRELDALRALIDHDARHGTAPTYKELGEALGIKPPWARLLVMGLLRKELVTVTPNKARSARVTATGLRHGAGG